MYVNLKKFKCINQNSRCEIRKSINKTCRIQNTEQSVTSISFSTLHQIRKNQEIRLLIQILFLSTPLCSSLLGGRHAGKSLGQHRPGNLVGESGMLCWLDWRYLHIFLMCVRYVTCFIATTIALLSLISLYAESEST